MKVKEVMTTPVFQVEANTSLKEACKLMMERGVGSIIVTEDGVPKGIFTDRDATRAMSLGLSPNDEVRLASSLGNLLTANEDMEVFEAVAMMSKNKIRHLPVKNREGEIIGMFAITDIAKVLPSL
ncbi:CBS domain-containing protein [Sulfuracidifex tepidarius]|uniref:Inosine-5'-monophosphate dehydrogenase n=1 Tax=Sulfuracidifex tepidarius TaxID=1294262 RepID=A0A510DS10_9CREN|nr:CBS domain-containing protein [Sulfuracidifex tepidarius]BBG22962.1 Inosine-5'-monophosphate dehydrogenase [Sulfuracidifex tepidarius]BBG25723.1 Inosine-5'-monophosphate dehydrogenase [Sulfuracidifex tepidarius]